MKACRRTRWWLAGVLEAAGDWLRPEDEAATAPKARAQPKMKMPLLGPWDVQTGHRGRGRIVGIHRAYGAGGVGPIIPSCLDVTLPADDGWWLHVHVLLTGNAVLSAMADHTDAYLLKRDAVWLGQVVERRRDGTTVVRVETLYLWREKGWG